MADPVAPAASVEAAVVSEAEVALEAAEDIGVDLFQARTSWIVEKLQI